MSQDSLIMGGTLQIVMVPFDTEKWYLPNFQQL